MSGAAIPEKRAVRIGWKEEPPVAVLWVGGGGGCHPLAANEPSARLAVADSGARGGGESGEGCHSSTHLIEPAHFVLGVTGVMGWAVGGAWLVFRVMVALPQVVAVGARGRRLTCSHLIKLARVLGWSSGNGIDAGPTTQPANHRCACTRSLFTPRPSIKHSAHTKRDSAVSSWLPVVARVWRVLYARCRVYRSGEVRSTRAASKSCRGVAHTLLKLSSTNVLPSRTRLCSRMVNSCG